MMALWLHPEVGPRRSEAGFTLLETLIALALLALIMGVLASSIRTARLALGYVERSQSTAAMGAARSYLRSVFFQARSVPPGAASSSKFLSFDGNAAAVRFVSTHVPQGQYEGLYVIDMTMEPSLTTAAKFNLVVRQSLFRPNAEEAGAATVSIPKAVLVADVERAAFSYFGVTDDEPSGQWTDSWRQPDMLPSLVGIDIQFARGDARRSQRINVPIYASGGSTNPCPPRVFCR